MNKFSSVIALSLLALTANAQNATQSAAKSASSASSAAASKAHILSNAEFDKLVATPQKLLIIDVRRPDEVSSIGGFPVYLSVQIGELEKSTAWIPKERPIVVVSNHAGRAGKGADILEAKGFKVLGAIGAQTYEEAGGKLTKIAVKSAGSSAASQASDKK